MNITIVGKTIFFIYDLSVAYFQHFTVPLGTERFLSKTTITQALCFFNLKYNILFCFHKTS